MNTLSNIEEIQKLIEGTEVVILQVGTETCAPCDAIKQRIDEWSRGRAGIETRYIPLESFPQVAADFGIFSAPTVMVYVQGKLTARESGYFSLDEILQRTERLIELAR